MASLNLVPPLDTTEVSTEGVKMGWLQRASTFHLCVASIFTAPYACNGFLFFSAAGECQILPFRS